MKGISKREKPYRARSKPFESYQTEEQHFNVRDFTPSMNLLARHTPRSQDWNCQAESSSLSIENSYRIRAWRCILFV
jgi:hypothetical protein